MKAKVSLMNTGFSNIGIGNASARGYKGAYDVFILCVPQKEIVFFTIIGGENPQEAAILLGTLKTYFK